MIRRVKATPTPAPTPAPPPPTEEVIYEVIEEEVPDQQQPDSNEIPVDDIPSLGEDDPQLEPVEADSNQEHEAAAQVPEQPGDEGVPEMAPEDG